VDSSILNGWSLFYYFILAFVYILFIHYLDRIEKRRHRNTPMSDEECLLRLARKQGCSEYDIFFQATGSWNIDKRRVEDDFNRYLTAGHMPYYVRDYIRRNRSQVDRNAMEPFVSGGRLPPSWSA
jgi:hypothetical protein